MKGWRRPSSSAALAGSIGFASIGLLFASSAAALTLDVTHSGPSVVGEAHAFTANVTDAMGEVTFEWRFGEADDFLAGGAEMSHTFTAPGHYAVDVVATDAGGNVASAFFQHLAHFPLSAARPKSSTSIVFDAARNRIYSVNQDNDTVTSIDPDGLMKVAELAVYERPESLALTPNGKLWVVHQDDYAVAVVDPDRFEIERGFRLPYASQPVGVAMSPTGDAAYVTLMAVGKLIKLDPATGDVLGECEVGARPRGISVSHDGNDVYVSRFISSDTEGEVVKVDARAMTVAARIGLAIDTESMDSDLEARGLPNYLFSVALTPDGRQAWVPGKKDNIVRGLLRDGNDLTHDTTVRPIACVIDTLEAREIPENRVDLDDRSMPVHVEFTPYGDFAILALAGSNRLEVRDVTRPTQVFSAISSVGAFPRASVLTPAGRLFVQAALSREVLVYDMTALLDDFDSSSPRLLGSIPCVASEKLSPQILEGKKIFHDAEDTRMAFEGYMSCGACHFEGIDDGRVWDFSTRGEGLRNTVAILGRRGTGQGRLNWTGNLDEIQDFEHQIRELFDGTGFLPDDVFMVGTRSEPLGDAKAGLSPELDALAAYVASLDHVNPSPYRNPNGSLSEAGELGKAVFEKLGCDFCHAGADFTDSARGSLHDVGTITEASGTRAGAPLTGIDTPTLLGVWETPPYLHDGSAPTIRDVLTTKNPDDLHGYVSSLSPVELDQLVEYVLEIDNELPVRRLPFEPEQPDGGTGGTGGTGGGATGGAGAAGSGAMTGGGGVAGSGGQPTPAEPHESSESASCACELSVGARHRERRDAFGALVSAFGFLGVLLVVAIRRRRRIPGVLASRSLPTELALLVALSVPLAACSSAEPKDEPHASPQGGTGGTGGSDWSTLPAVTHPDRELAELGSRLVTLERVCARGRGDPFSTALCATTEPPKIDGMKGLIDFAGLGEERAFALTGNSTSLVAPSVSAINPRIIVFPRVEDDLAQPEALTALGFVRGEQFVEIVSRDPATDDLNFYLLAFEQACSYADGGCDLAGLLSEELEHEWTAYSVYDHDDLETTSFDCKSCHEPGGSGSKRILRMQELASPWMHWFPQRFVQRTDSDRLLLAHFSRVHEAEQQYGGIPIAVILNALDEGSSAQLEALVRAEGFGEQPNPFDAQIAKEAESGPSATWQLRFDAHLRGEAIAVPYPAIDVTDEALRIAAGDSFRNFLQGTNPREGLLDLRRVFSNDAMQKLSFVPQPDADGRTVLLQMCARCHDGRGNPALAKNRFDVRKLDDMPPELRERAIERMNATDDTRMPPWRTGSLTPEAIAAATLELQGF